MQPFVENYQKRSLEFYDLHLFSIIHILYIQCLLTEFTNKIIKLSDASCALTGYDVLANGGLSTMQYHFNYKTTMQLTGPTAADVVVPYKEVAMTPYEITLERRYPSYTYAQH